MSKIANSDSHLRSFHDMLKATGQAVKGRESSVMENENAFKNWINPELVKRISKVFREFQSSFNPNRFEKCIPSLKALELKARVLLLKDALKEELPSEYPKAILIIMQVIASRKLKSFELWPISEYISECGKDHFELSFQAMYELTPLFTSEFAIRPFLLKNHERCLKILKAWAKDENHHVRRWISEGTRPILPWGGKIPVFIQNPQLTLPLLEELKYDDEIYVRKSVANHLNDISKNHPDLVVKILKRWNKEVPPNHQDKMNWITRHALRVLIKKAHPGALKLIGVGSRVEIKFHSLKLKAKKFKVGDVLEFEIEFSSTSKKKQKVIVDYLIHFVKARGKTSPKVFKLKGLVLEPGEKVSLVKKHSLKKITTMTFYKGMHEVSIQINGKIFEKASWAFNP